MQDPVRYCGVVVLRHFTMGSPVWDKQNVINNGYGFELNTVFMVMMAFWPDIQ
jgi:hypothetical protein